MTLFLVLNIQHGQSRHNPCLHGDYGLEWDIDWNQIRLVPRFLIGSIIEMGKLDKEKILGEDK